MVEHPGKQGGEQGITEISLFDVWGVLAGRKMLILITTAVSVAVSLAIAIFSTPYYSASVLLAPVNAEELRGSLAGLSPQLRSLTGLAGFSSSNSKKEEYIATLGSRVLTEGYIEDNNLLQMLFADDWDAESESWKNRDPIWLVRTLRKLIRLASGEPDPPQGDGSPSLWLAYREFEEIRSVVVDLESSLVTLTVEWTDPRLAAEWANGLVDAANLFIRLRAAEEAQVKIAYLNEEVRKTSLSRLEDAFYALIEQEIQTAMIANVRQDFAFRVIDPATVPEMRARPKRFLIIFVGLLVGLLGGAFFALFRHALDKHRERQM